MTIILMRHGKPEQQTAGRINAQALAAWCRAYDMAPVCDAPPARSLAIARQAEVIVSSPLPRARSSLTQLGMQPNEIDALFREVAVPELPSERLHLPPTLWLALLYFLWLCGLAGRTESLQHARQRARQAADKLVALSRRGTVLLVGHGLMNKMITRELRKRGWQAEKHASSRHWSTSIYHRPFI
ncbi:histidine phosphatase family protein [[Erwinia] mediterraneensis]|uniref:histidine phosphatase family protein n=1 Tax=[Erwinia] mediterraneensis TaxID=2161819 RepID=UPI00102FD06A|nr:histidine phosphatase family protein [[Erwinia] mediterraneensis]